MTCFRVCFITFYFLTTAVCGTLILNDLDYKFLRDIHQLAERYLTIVKPLSFINAIIDRKVIPSISDKILNAYKLHPIILNDPSEKCTVHNSPNSYMKIYYIVGIYKTPQYVEPSKWQIFYGSNWNSGAFIVIWITSPTTREEIQPLLTRFWIHSSVNVIAIAFHPIENRTNVYSYDPFRIKNDGTRGEIFQVPKKGTLFLDKLKNLHEYKIPISLYHHQPHARLNHFTQLSDSMDVNYCQFLARFMNFTIILKTAQVELPKYIVKLPNGYKAGVIGDILINRSHFIGNSMYWEVSDIYPVDVVYPRWRSEVLVAVPRALPTPGILLLLKSNSGLTLVLIAVALTILFIFFYIRHDKNPFLKILAVFLFQNFGKVGKKTAERLFAISWIYWSFLLITIFQSQLIDDLCAPPFYNDIENLVELDHSNLTLLVRRWEYNAVNHSFVKHKKKLIQRMAIEVNASKCGMSLLQYRNVACTVDRSFAKYTISEITKAIYKKETSNKSKASWQIHFIQEPLIKFWKTYAVKKNSPYLEKINEATSRLVEMGIMEKWKNDDIFREFKVSPSLNKFSHLTLDNMDKVFMFLIYGNTLATVVFILEIVCFKLKLNFLILKKHKNYKIRRKNNLVNFI